MKCRDEADTFNFYNEIFTQFDEATCAFGIEKIKTVRPFIYLDPRPPLFFKQDKSSLCFVLSYVLTVYF